MKWPELRPGLFPAIQTYCHFWRFLRPFIMVQSKAKQNRVQGISYQRKQSNSAPARIYILISANIHEIGAFMRNSSVFIFDVARPLWIN